MVFKFNINKIYSTFLLLLYQVNNINTDYISIPFKINIIENTQFSSIESQITELISNKIYFPLKIGHPLQDVYGTINSLEFEILMKKSENLFNKKNFFFNITNSDSFSIMEEIFLWSAMCSANTTNATGTYAAKTVPIYPGLISLNAPSALKNVNCGTWKNVPSPTPFSTSASNGAIFTTMSSSLLKIIPKKVRMNAKI